MGEWCPPKCPAPCSCQIVAPGPNCLALLSGHYWCPLSRSPCMLRPLLSSARAPAAGSHSHPLPPTSVMRRCLSVRVWAGHWAQRFACFNLISAQQPPCRTSVTVHVFRRKNRAQLGEAPCWGPSSRSGRWNSKSSPFNSTCPRACSVLINFCMWIIAT